MFASPIDLHGYMYLKIVKNYNFVPMKNLCYRQRQLFPTFKNREDSQVSPFVRMSTCISETIKVGVAKFVDNVSNNCAHKILI